MSENLELHDHEHEHHDHEHHEHHDHEESCECGCGCDHDHEHEDHDHDHHHDHEQEHHDHDHEHHHHHEHEDHHTGHELDHVKSKKHTFIVENLGCANCAAKMENEIGKLPEVEGAVLTFATKKLVVAAEDDGHLREKLQQICSSIEHQVEVVPEKSVAKAKGQKEDFWEENRKEALMILAGAILFAAGIIAEHTGAGVWVIRMIFIAAYLILGLEVLKSAVMNLSGGQIFDENFLMSVATLAAFAIGDYPEAVGVMLFYRIGEFFEDAAVFRSRRQIMDAVDLRPEKVLLVHGDHTHETDPAKVRVGDVILVRPGDRIGLDGIVEKGESYLDTSAITGEPAPREVKAGDEALSGCVNEQGTLTIRVTKPLSESMVTRILDSVENAAASKPVIDRFITRFARIYTPIVVAAAVLTAIIPSVITGDWHHWIYTAVTFLVISCPCALVLSVPLAFFAGIGVASKQGILFKGGLAMEVLKNVKAVVLDKTGTITKGEFKVQEVIGEGAFSGEKGKNELLKYAAECEKNSTHPIGVSIVAAAGDRNITLSDPERMEEISGKGIAAVIDGHRVLCGNSKLMEMNDVRLDSDLLATRGGTEVFVAVDDTYAGQIVIADAIKEDAKKSIAQIKRAGLTPVMLTGDEERGAEYVAAETGITEVYAKLLPDEKLEKLGELKKRYGSVMFVGDGINDAPVLAGADVGAAMGSGADAAIEAADVVYMTSSVQAIGQSVEIARETGRIAIQNVVFALAVKALVMILGFAGHANMWMAVFADTGVAMLCVLNSVRTLMISNLKK